MSITRSRAVAVVALAAVALVLLAPSAGADAASDEARILTLLNQARASAGAAGLVVNPSLSSAARSWAGSMARAGAISHNPNLSTIVTGWTRIGENVARGSSADAVHQALLASPAHRQNMVDPAFNSVGVGVAYGGGSLFVVQDFAALPTAAANHPPAMPTAVTPDGGATLRTSPTQASARYADPDGTLGYVYFKLIDRTGAAVRQGWSNQVCSGCTATFAFAGLPDGVYAMFTAGWDGALASAWSTPKGIWISHTTPSAPTAVSATRAQVSARYADPDGATGYVYFWVRGPSGALVKEGFSGAACSGCTAALALPALASGSYTVVAAAFDGLVSPAVGPVAVTM
jgi:hypothetical protein